MTRAARGSTIAAATRASTGSAADHAVMPPGWCRMPASTDHAPAVGSSLQHLDQRDVVQAEMARGGRSDLVRRRHDVDSARARPAAAERIEQAILPRPSDTMMTLVGGVALQSAGQVVGLPTIGTSAAPPSGRPVPVHGHRPTMSMPSQRCVRMVSITRWHRFRSRRRAPPPGVASHERAAREAPAGPEEGVERRTAREAPSVNAEVLAENNGDEEQRLQRGGRPDRGELIARLISARVS